MAGASWIVGVATLNVSAQLSLPDWVRGRGLAMYMTVVFGSMALGSSPWGQVATVTNLQVALHRGGSDACGNPADVAMEAANWRSA